MPYSCEEIFKTLGQFDAFVELTFFPDSEAFKVLGRTLYGTFKYTNAERSSLQKIIDSANPAETDGYIKFEATDVTKEIKIYLDNNGILNTDIAFIASLDTQKTNRYTTEGEREIENQIIIQYDAGGMSTDKLKLVNFRMRIAGGYPLIEQEWEQYIGLELFHSPARLTPEMNARIFIEGVVNSTIRYYYLYTKFYHADLGIEEMKEYIILQTARSKAASEILLLELKKSTEKIKELSLYYRDSVRQILLISIHFETRVILPYKFPIWWNLERFLHIYLRHVKETNVGDRFVGKSLFKYKFDDIRSIVSSVLQKIYSEVVEHFSNGNTKVFSRVGKMSIYYDGSYYRVEVEHTGLLRTFHPEEIRESSSEDKKAEDRPNKTKGFRSPRKAN